MVDKRESDTKSLQIRELIEVISRAAKKNKAQSEDL